MPMLHYQERMGQFLAEYTEFEVDIVLGLCYNFQSLAGGLLPASEGKCGMRL